MLYACTCIKSCYCSVSSEISWPISTKFYVDPAVETGLKVCSDGHAPLTVMPVYGEMMMIKKNKQKKNNNNKKQNNIFLL